MKRAVLPLPAFALVAAVIAAGAWFGVWRLTAKPAIAPTRSANVNAEPADSAVAYRDTQTGFRLNYPKGWTVSEDSSGEGENAIRNVTFTGPENAVTATIASTSLEGVIRETFSVSKETSVSLNGVPGTRLDASSGPDGGPHTVIIIKRGNTLITFNGYGQEFEDLMSTFTWPETIK